MIEPNPQKEDNDKHAYSCKRCRRLKKKCTRTVPKCLNCTKAGESCDYVPRAPRRKKNEILKSFGESRNQSSLTQSDTQSSLISNSAALHSQSRPGYYMNSSVNNPSVSSPLASSHQQHQPPLPLNTTQQASLYHHRAPQPFTLQRRSSGAADLLSYSSGEASTYSLLPPISSITSTMNSPSNGFLHSETPKLNNIQHFGGYPFAPSLSFNGTQQPIRKFSTTASVQSQQSSGSSDLNRRFEPNAILVKNNILTGICGANTTTQFNSDHADSTIRPELPINLLVQFADAYFSEFSRNFPFLRKEHYMFKIQSIDLEKIDHMKPTESFEMFMIFLIGYSSLERRKKIPSDKNLFKYLVQNSLNQTAKILTYDSLDSVRQLMFLAIYSLFEENGVLSWFLGGIVTKLSISLGLNRKPNKFQGDVLSEEDLEMRKRLFWSVYSFDKQVSVALGCPASFDDDDINLDDVVPLQSESADEVEIINQLLALRRLEAKIVKNVHSINSGRRFQSEDSKNQLFVDLRAEIEEWYKATSDMALRNERISSKECGLAWFSNCYYHMLMTLYRPSHFKPNPSHETMKIVSTACLGTIRNLHSLQQLHFLPLLWPQLYKLLAAVTIFLACLVDSSADMIQTRKEMNLGLELAEAFAEKWTIAKKITGFIREFQKAIVDSDFGSTAKQQDELAEKVVSLAHSYYDALTDSKANIWFDDPVIENVREYRAKNK